MFTLFESADPPQPNDLCLPLWYHGDETGLACAPDGPWPTVAEAVPHDAWPTLEYLGRWNGRALWGFWREDDSLEEWGLRSVLASISPDGGRAVARAVELWHWDRGHRFCGACGAPTERRQGQVVRDCPQCGQEFWPRVTPAVIVLVHKGDQVLLARNARSRRPFFSCVAGFVEAGESLEDAAAREVLEEVGVEVGPPQYAASQAWPFPHALMTAFFAPWVSGDLRPDGREISEVHWYRQDELPLLPPPMSIARRLVRQFYGDPTL